MKTTDAQARVLELAAAADSRGDFFDARALRACAEALTPDATLIAARRYNGLRAWLSERVAGQMGSRIVAHFSRNEEPRTMRTPSELDVFADGIGRAVLDAWPSDDADAETTHAAERHGSSGDVHISCSLPTGEKLGGWTTRAGTGEHVPDEPTQDKPDAETTHEAEQRVPFVVVPFVVGNRGEIRMRTRLGTPLGRELDGDELADVERFVQHCARVVPIPTSQQQTPDYERERARYEEGYARGYRQRSTEVSPFRWHETKSGATRTETLIAAASVLGGRLTLDDKAREELSRMVSALAGESMADGTAGTAGT
jgi:hypothetical protein